MKGGRQSRFYLTVRGATEVRDRLVGVPQAVVLTGSAAEEGA